MNAIHTFLATAKNFKLCNSIIGDGPGKTTAALEFSKNNLNVPYLNCHHPDTPNNIFQTLNRLIQSDEIYKTSPSLTSLVNILIETLNRTESLIVVDNADCLSATSMYYFSKLYESTKGNVGFTFIGRQRFYNNLLRYARGGMVPYEMVLPSNILFVDATDLINHSTNNAIN